MATATASVSRERRQYQAEGSAFLERVERGLLADEPGLGKSRQLIEASRGRTLVVATAMVLDGGTWDDEIKFWADDPARFTQVAYTSIGEREKTVSENGNPGNRPTDRLIQDLRGKWDTVILDEAHNVKGRKTSWTKAIQKLKADRLYEATGTPFPNWAHESFTLLQLLFPEKAHPGKDLGAYWRWVGQWFDTAPNRFSKDAYSVGDMLACSKSCLDRPVWDPCEHYLDFMRANFGDRFLRRRRDDVLPELPPLTEQVVHTPMTPAQRKIYTELRKDFVAWAEDGTEFVAWNDAAKHVKLDQVTTGLFTADPGRSVKESESGKLKMLLSDLNGRSRPTFVVAHYRSTLEGLAEFVSSKLKMKVGVIHGGTSSTDRGRLVRRFQAGQMDALFGSIETVAEGLTLTAADMCIFVEKSYKPSRNEQAKYRTYRLGQTRPVTVRDYVVPHSVDSAKRVLLATKTDRQMRHLTAADLLRDA